MVPNAYAAMYLQVANVENEDDEVPETQLIGDSQFVPASVESSTSLELAPPLLFTPRRSTRSTRKNTNQMHSIETLPPSDPIEESSESTPHGGNTVGSIETQLVKDLITDALTNDTQEDIDMLGEFC